MSEALDRLLDDGVIDAVLGQLKSGKEAEVWLVQHAGNVLAAKVYKERHERNFKNNAGYLEGRDVRNSRTRRAIAKGSKFGQAMAEDEWKRAEADALYKLHAAGVRVPTPAVFYEGVLLMETVVDAEGRPAPRLVEAPPASAQEAHALYLDLREQVIRMLCTDLIHGDLSAFNILMAGTGPTIIDFPQTLAAARNTQAERYFKRDLDNVRNFLAGIDRSLQSFAGDSHEIWNAYTRRELVPGFVPRQRGGGRQERGPQHERGHRGPPQHAAPPTHDARPVATPAPSSPPELDPLEAELRAIEATFLKQGGGDRAKPGPPPRDEQNWNRRDGRKFGNNRGGGGQRGPRPPQGQGQQRNAQGPGGQQQRSQQNAGRGQNAQGTGGQQQRPQQNERRGQNAQGPGGQQQRPQQNDQRRQNAPGSGGQHQNDRRDQNPQGHQQRSQQNDRRGQNPQQRPPNDQRGPGSQNAGGALRGPQQQRGNPNERGGQNSQQRPQNNQRGQGSQNAGGAPRGNPNERGGQNAQQRWNRNDRRDQNAQQPSAPQQQERSHQRGNHSPRAPEVSYVRKIR